MEQGSQPTAEAAFVPAGPMSPVASTERVELIDVLRGFAIFGILLVNMQMFFAPLYLFTTTAEWWPSAIDRASRQLILLVGQGKFYSLFSILFGMGMAIQMERAERRGVAFGGFFARRMTWLLVIGLVHAVLFWFGDILVLYSLMGFALILFRKCSNKTLLVWTVILFVVPVIVVGGIVVLLEVGRLLPEAAVEIDRALAEQEQLSLQRLADARRVYADGSFGEILGQRLGQLRVVYGFYVMFFAGVLALFLVGLNLGRRRFFHRPEAYVPFFRRWIWRFFALGVVGNGLGLFSAIHANPSVPSFIGLAGQIGMTFGAPTLMLFYVSAIALAFQHDPWRRRLSRLAPVGRMALTNYLTHSVVFTTLANGYGFGLYARVPPSVGLLLTVAMYALQIPLSAWWLARFRFGPMEWLWRSLTYFAPQPMRR